jgi:hypothetical protein
MPQTNTNSSTSPQKNNNSSSGGGSQWQSAKNNLVIMANAAAIELYFLCVEDEQDAEKLCTKCSEKFFINLSLSETIMQAPLIASCIQVLGRLALKYPSLAKTSVKYLTDFLTEPSPILLKQYKHIIEKLTHQKGGGGGGAKSPPTPLVNTNNLNKTLDNQSKTLRPGGPQVNLIGVNGTRSLSRSQTLAYKGGADQIIGAYNNLILVSYSKSTRIFEFLRDLTIECLCLSLNSCYTIDKECIKAVCTRLASRLYTADILDK